MMPAGSNVKGLLVRGLDQSSRAHFINLMQRKLAGREKYEVSAGVREKVLVAVFKKNKARVQLRAPGSPDATSSKFFNEELLVFSRVEPRQVF